MNVERPIDNPALSVDADKDAASDARAEADFAAGRCIPQDEVMKWVRALGTVDAFAMPREWYE